MSDEVPLIKVEKTIEFKRNVKRLGKKYRLIEEDIEPLIKQLEAGETPGDKISGNKYSVYKTRVKNSDIRKGKSGGYRVIYYTVTRLAIILTTIYSKSERDDITNREIENIIEQYELELASQNILEKAN